MSQKNAQESEVINMKNIQGHSSQTSHNPRQQQDEINMPGISGSGRVFLENESESNQQLESKESSYKDLDEIKELGLSMARKKQIR